MSDKDVDSPFPTGQRWSVPTTPFWRRALWFGVGLLLVISLVWAIRPGTDANRTRGIGVGGPVPVGVATVAGGDVRVTADALGTVTPLATVTIHPQVTGYLNRFDVTEGQMVKAGQVLAEIDPRPFQAALDQAKGQLARDLSTLANAKIDLERYQALWTQNAISRQVLQTQAATVGSDQGTVAADKAAVESARINLGYCRVTAPVAGRVGLRQVDPGNLVVSGTTSAIIVVTQLQPISVIFSLPEDSIDAVMRHVNAGRKLLATAFDRSMTNKLAQGTLSNVDNQVDASTGMVKMRAMFDNPDLALFPNQFVNIRLLLDTLHGQTYAPAAAIQHGAQGSYVYVIDKDRTAKMRTVKTGPTDGDKVAIVEGVRPGEMVVVDGADRLKDGATVSFPAAKGEITATTSDSSREHHGTGNDRHHNHGDSTQGSGP